MWPFVLVIVFSKTRTARRPQGTNIEEDRLLEARSIDAVHCRKPLLRAG
jgi:hypothetical protein